MRKNHHGKKDRLVKRVFALCLALAVICTCLVPVFATEGLIDPQVNQEASRPVDDGEASYPDDEFAGFGGDEAAGFGEPREVYDEGEAAGFGEDEVATRPVEGGEDNLDGGPTVTDSEWGTVIEYGPSSSTGTDPEPETQWSGEDDVVEKPDDKVVVSGDEIKKLQDMVVYRFWLKELNTLDLQDITAQAQINNMTESEYLARNGEVLWNLYFIQAVPRAETIADYSSYIENPSSNRDPKGELRQFDYWYTLDEFGNRVRLNLTDPTSNILDDKTTTVNVYAAWKDGTVGSDEEEDVDHEDLVDKNPVPVDLETKASASYEDEDGNTKSVNLPVEVKNLPSAADHLNVIHMGDDDMESFYESHEDSFGEMMPILGLKISPKNAKGETVQPAKGQKATVTVSGLDKLPEIAAMEEEGALTADALKVLHQKDDKTVEKLDVVSYENGTLTFETSSFSPFVIANVNGYAAETLDNTENWTVGLDEIRRLDSPKSDYQSGKNYSNHQWWIQSGSDAVEISPDTGAQERYFVKGLKVDGNATIVHTYELKRIGRKTLYYRDIFNVTVTRYSSAAVFILSNPKGDPDKNDDSVWVPSASENNVIAKVDMTLLNTWIASKDTEDSAKNCVDTDELRTGILKWPDASQSGREWVINRDDRYFDTVLGWVWDNYKAGIAADLQIDPNKIQKSDVDSFTVTVHKISRRNAGTYPTHLDCTISVNNKEYFTAKFWTYNPETHATRYVDAKDYERGQSVKLTTNDFPQTIEGANGTIYKFAGWRVENTDASSTSIYDPDKPLTWDYEPTDEELADGVVHFYAIYTPASANLTVTKTVTGKLGDTNKAFTFQILDASGKPVKLTNGNYEFGNTNGALLSDGTDGKFTLKDGASIIFKNLPSGQYKVVEDNYSGEKYETSYVVDSGTPVNGQEATVTIGTDAKQIDFTNHRTLEPDLGVLLDTLPYIVILAVVAGGVALLMLRKRRKEDD